MRDSNTKSNDANLLSKSPAIYLVEDINELEQLAISWLSKPHIAVDTEFERRTTHYAKLALIQIFDGNAIYLVDPLKTDCPNALRQLFNNASVTKIFHSCKEDLEVLYTAWNCTLNGLFDTQVASNFLTQELSVGYAKLVEQLTGHYVDKQETNSDWIKRPLSENQLVYAASDVLYLNKLFEILSSTLKEKAFKHFFEMECAELCVSAKLKIDTPADYREAKEIWELGQTDLSLFKLLFEWREEKAKLDNRTKNHIAKDYDLIRMADMKPLSINELKLVGDIHPRSIRHYADEWFEIIADWKSSSKAVLTVVANPRDVQGLKALSAKFDLLIKEKAKALNIFHTLLLSKRLTKKLAYSLLTDSTPPPQWSGWRKKILVADINELYVRFLDARRLKN